MAPVVKVLLPALAIAIVIYRVRARTPQWKQILGMVPPLWPRFALWVVAYAAWMLATNALLHWRGPWDFTSWHNDTLLHDAERVLAVGILGPIAEELIFRGFFFNLMSRTRVRVLGTILITSLIWASLHVQYDARTLLLVFADGLSLGAARWNSRSVWTPIAMHIVWNLYAVW